MNFKIDLDALNNKLYKKTFKYSEVKDKLQKVAFDVVRFKDSDDLSGLWKIEKTNDGEVIVALYDANLEKEASKEKSWKIVPNSSKTTLSFFYKDHPITKVASSELKISPSEINSVTEFLPAKLASNAKLRHNLLSLLSISQQSDLMQKFPELFEDK